MPLYLESEPRLAGVVLRPWRRHLKHGEEALTRRPRVLAWPDMFMDGSRFCKCDSLAVRGP